MKKKTKLFFTDSDILLSLNGYDLTTVISPSVNSVLSAVYLNRKRV